MNKINNHWVKNESIFKCYTVIMPILGLRWNILVCSKIKNCSTIFMKILLLALDSSMLLWIWSSQFPISSSTFFFHSGYDSNSSTNLLYLSKAFKTSCSNCCINHWITSLVSLWCAKILALLLFLSTML